MSDAGNNQRDLNGLLKFCLEATKAEDGTPGPASLDPERRQFLQEVLAHVTADPIEELRKAITTVCETIRHIPTDVDGDSNLVAEVVRVVDEVILDIVLDTMDYANDFYKLDGLELIHKLLDSHVTALKVKGCELIAETAQNNPPVQEIILKAGLLKEMCELLDGDPDEAIQLKALYAISCIVRENEVGTLKFDSDYDGLSVLLRTIQKNSPNLKLKTKACFLISALCVAEERVRESLCRMGMVQQLVALLHQDHDPSHEFVASALYALISNHVAAQNDCLRPELGLEQLLRSRIEELKDRQEFFVEWSYCRDILKLCFPSNDDEGDGDR